MMVGFTEDLDNTSESKKRMMKEMKMFYNEFLCNQKGSMPVEVINFLTI